jgi:uncharacterized protein YbaR (Trm112 family)
LPRCDYCGLYSDYPICPYDQTTLYSEYDRQCHNTVVTHNLSIPLRYRGLFANTSINPNFLTVAACPNCKTPYFYSQLSSTQREQFNRMRQTSGCFIATAAVGSHLHPYVENLRHFRDSVLLESRYKRNFENLLGFYYRFSPPIARSMMRHRVLRVFLRYTLVYPVVFGIKVILPICDLILGIKRDHKRRNR